jgi:hypothetical protein
MTVTKSERHILDRKFDHKLWISMLGAPVLWLIYLQTAYVLVQPACASGSRSILHLTSLFALGLTLVLGGTSLAQWLRTSRAAPFKEEATAGRQHAMAVIGTLQSALP